MSASQANPEPSGQALPAGTRLEEFVIERVLGSGGFGITYLAKDTALGRQVVIKENLPVQFCFRDTHSLTVAPRHTSGEDADNFQWSLENFSKEAAMLASLDHSGIVRVLRSFEAFGTAYFVMPFVEGLTLDDLIRERSGKNPAFTEEELKGLLSRVLKSLSYLHDRGIYHRDIKPGNLLITHEGIPVLIDFGSARQRLSERSMTVVQSGGYTPFEQLQSRGNVGPWSDLYALGGTLVKAMTGQTLPGANDRVFDDPWQALADRGELLHVHTAEFLGSIDRALALHPRDRWQDASEWQFALTAPAVPTPQVFPVAPVVNPVAVALPVTRRPVAPIHQPGEERDFYLTDSMKIRMCWIPPGEFLMGSPVDELGRREGETQHRVEITRGFWMGKYPVTQAQWLAVMRNRPSRFGRPNFFDSLFDGNSKELWDHHPVERVSWNDVCGVENRSGGFLGKVNGGGTSGDYFHLPTEAQWEYACRAGTTGAYAGDLDQIAWYSANSGGKTHPVGTKKANAWGLHDMHGNVWEWCTDRYGNELAGGVDPQGAASGVSRVYRGGSWFGNAVGCRAAFRLGLSPDRRSNRLGFRPALVPSK
jgi:formylglycine-generating enzyme required for sulfatase activity